jgi:cytoskeletal protein RodZ
MARKRGHFWIGLTIGLLAALLAIVLALLFVPSLRAKVGLESKQGEQTTTNTQNTQATTPEPETKPEPKPETEPSTPTSTTPVPTTSKDISVTVPGVDALVSSPMLVRGEARVFENNVSLRLTDADGEILAETFATAEAPDIGQFGPFQISLSFSRPTTSTGTLEVFEASARDGSEINKVTIPVRFE